MMNEPNQDKQNSRQERGRNQRGGAGDNLSNYVFGKIQPQALPLEEAVLGALMLDREALPVVMDILRPESFYLEAHQHIYRAVIKLFERSNPVDLLTVTEELRKSGDLDKVGGGYYLVELTNRVASAANIEYHARIIAQKHIQRELISMSTRTIRDAYEDTTDVFDLLDEAEKGLFAITQNNLSRTFESMGTLSGKVLKQIEELAGKADGLTGVPTGFTDLDRLTSGWQPSDLIILAARPGMGKTSLILAMALNAAKDFNKGVALFSLEMANTQLVSRLISMEAEIPGSKMRSGKLEDYEWQMLQSTVEKLSLIPVFIDDTPGINIFELRAKCRRLKMQHDIQLIIIDYLQLMTGASENNRNANREQEIAGISRALKGMAKELNVPVIALSQLSRAVEVRGGSKRPQLSDLRESGCLTGDTLIVDAGTGARIPIRELAEKGDLTGFYTLGMDENQHISAHLMTKAFYSGKKQVFELTLDSGRKIKASANHPFYKQEGWTALEDLGVGDRIAVPREIGIYLADQLSETELATSPAVAESLEIAHSVSSLFKSGVSRDRTRKIEVFMPDGSVHNLTRSDIYWDKIKSIEAMGLEDVYDATVPGVHNFIANDFIVHNSIEQDADIVGFIYRPEYYGILEDESGVSLKGIAEVIIAKHRHGALDSVRLKFTDTFAKFGNLDDPAFAGLEDPLTGPFQPSVITRQSRMNDEDIPF